VMDASNCQHERRVASKEPAPDFEEEKRARKKIIRKKNGKADIA